MGSYKDIIFEKKPPIAWVTFNRPDKLNAISLTLIQELGDVLDTLWDDEEIKVLVLTGTGDRAFCAGADITMFQGQKPNSMFHIIRKIVEVTQKMEKFPKPIIAAINGFALGGGCELAISCDFRLASEKAAFGQPEIMLGLIPGAGGTQRLAKLIGLGRAKELCMLGNRIPADEAHRIGLVNMVFPTDKFKEEVQNFANRLAEGPPVALKMAKYACNFGTQVPLDVGLVLESGVFSVLFGTEDMVEGTSAFLEKRKAKFSGK
ncbi:MAG: enoyl-CoA hydratase/isomerase family protein [Candidatus Jordarchaeum sp.]|uniref:enoyl-CoA hydratase/isomerase family protein n=1 Tax=Candidatus Jordarchaeum sp. TaxID=2823881 RepID=UPI00404A7EC7